MIRRATGRSSLRSCLAALSANSIVHAELTIQFLERDQSLEVLGNPLRDPLRE